MFDRYCHHRRRNHRLVPTSVALVINWRERGLFPPMYVYSLIDGLWAAFAIKVVKFIVRLKLERGICWEKWTSFDFRNCLLIIDLSVSVSKRKIENRVALELNFFLNCILTTDLAKSIHFFLSLISIIHIFWESFNFCQNVLAFAESAEEVLHLTKKCQKLKNSEFGLEVLHFSFKIR